MTFEVERLDASRSTMGCHGYVWVVCVCDHVPRTKAKTVTSKPVPAGNRNPNLAAHLKGFDPARAPPPHDNLVSTSIPTPNLELDNGSVR